MWFSKLDKNVFNEKRGKPHVQWSKNLLASHDSTPKNYHITNVLTRVSQKSWNLQHLLMYYDLWWIDDFCQPTINQVFEYVADFAVQTRVLKASFDRFFDSYSDTKTI